MPFLPESIRPTWVTKKFAQADQRARAAVAKATGDADMTLIKTAEDAGYALYDHLPIARPPLPVTNTTNTTKRKKGRS